MPWCALPAAADDRPRCAVGDIRRRRACPSRDPARSGSALSGDRGRARQSLSGDGRGPHLSRRPPAAARAAGERADPDRQGRPRGDHGGGRGRSTLLLAYGRLPRLSGRRRHRTATIAITLGSDHETSMRGRRLLALGERRDVAPASARQAPTSSPSWRPAAPGRRRSARPGSSRSPRRWASSSTNRNTLGELGKIKAMVETGNVPIDLVTVETATVLQGCDAGVLIRLDYSKIADRATSSCPAPRSIAASASMSMATSSPTTPTVLKDGADLGARYLRHQEIPGQARHAQGPGAELSNGR